MASPVVLTLLQFNVQHCAGGLEGLFSDTEFDAGDAALQDLIITESFAPVLDVLVQHPSWTFTFEMQGYMLEIIEKRHPEVLAQLQTLHAAGQVELVSFHWSAQLFTAFPPRDMEESVARTQAKFEEHSLSLSPIVYAPEGQLSQGMLERMPDWGYRVAILPNTLGEYLWGSADETIFVHGETLVLPTVSNAYVTWSYAGDGGQWATDGRDCTDGPAFLDDPAATQVRVAELEAAETTGSVISGVTDYVAGLSVEPAALPPLVDAIGQPEATHNLGLWMGEGGAWAETESDNGVRTANTRARNAVLAAEPVAGAAADLIDQAWEALLLAEVSNATGRDPYEAQVAYGLDWSAEAERLASEAVAEACDGAAWLYVTDAGSASVTITPDGEAPEPATVTVPPELPIATVTGREATPRYRTDDDGLRLDIEVAAGEGDLAVTFPWDGLDYTTVPALGDTLVTVPVEDIAAQDVALPLSWGVVHLEDDWYLVLHHDSVHVAARFGDDGITISDTTVPTEAFTWSFHLVNGATTDPVEVARHINIEPDVILPCPEPEKENFSTIPSDCDCASSRGAPWLALVALLALRRRHSV